MSSVLRYQASQSTTTCSSIPQEEQTQADEIQETIAAATQAFFQELFHTHYMNQHGFRQTITQAEEIGPLM